MLIGIDGGGTGTRLVLAGMDGTVIQAVKGPASNFADLGFDEGLQRISEMLAVIPPDKRRAVRSVYAGIAGTGNAETRQKLNSELKLLMPDAVFVDNNTDAFNPLYSESAEGIVLIIGTGSSAFAVSGGVCHQVGGWGYLIDDAGSGFRIGSDVLKSAYMAYDGRGKDTLLVSLCERKLGCALSSAIPGIYRGGKTYIASFAPLAFEALELGDHQAERIIERAADDIALSLRTCLKYTDRLPACAVISGGLSNNSVYLDRIAQALGEDTGRLRLIVSEMPQVYGALSKSALNAGITPDSAFKSNFSLSYKE